MQNENQQLIASWKRPRSSAAVKNCSWSKTSSELIAVAASDFTVTIINHLGSVINTIQLISNCLSMKWCRKSNILAILPTDLGQLIFWNELQNCHFVVQLNVKESLTWMSWSKSDHLYVAIGTIKGNLILYDYGTKKFNTIYGKHLKAITCGCWSGENYLILGSEDCTVTVNSSDGKTLKTLLTKTGPGVLKIVPDTSTLISLLIGRRAFFLYDLSSPNSPIEITFRKSYGSILGYKWCSRTVCLVLFANGQLVRLTYNSDGEQTIRESLEKIDSCPRLSLIAIVTREQVRKQQFRMAVFDGQLIRIQRDFGDSVGGGGGGGGGGGRWLQIAVDDCVHIKWNCTGQLLASIRKNGHLAIFALEANRQQVVRADSRVGCLTTAAAVTALTFFQISSQATIGSKNGSFLKKCADLKLSNAIYCFAFASNVLVAVGTNSDKHPKVYIYALSSDCKSLELRHEKLTSRKISDLQMNSKFVSFLIDGSLYVHQLYRLLSTNTIGSIELDAEENVNGGRVTYQCMDEANILYVASENGSIRYYEIVSSTHKDGVELQLIFEYLHEKAVVMVVPRPETIATSCLFDRDGRLFVLIAATTKTDRLLVVPDFRSRKSAPVILWQLQQQHGIASAVSSLFACLHELQLSVYAIFEERSAKRIDLVIQVASFLEISHVPLLFCADTIFVWDTQSELEMARKISSVDEQPETVFDFALKFGDYGAAIEKARELKESEVWTRLIRHLIERGLLSLAKAIAVDEHLWSLQKLIDSLVLDRRNGDCEFDFRARLAVYDQDYDSAAEWLRRANRPIAIVRMKMRLQRWESALRLAQQYRLESELITISKLYAKQLEEDERYADAVMIYKRNVDGFDSEIERGMLNCYLMLKNYETVASLAAKSNDSQLIEWCADRLREKNRWQSAVVLYELCGPRTNDKLIGSLLEQVEVEPDTNSAAVQKLAVLFDGCDSSTVRGEYVQRYAAYLEKSSDFQAAARLYRETADFDRLVRLELMQRNDPNAAVRILRESGSKSAARVAAELFVENGDFTAAVECLLLGDQFDEAFRLADVHLDRLQALGKIFERIANKRADKIATKYFDRLAMSLKDAFAKEAKSQQENVMLVVKYFKMAQNWSQAFDCLIEVAAVAASGTSRIDVFTEAFEIARLADTFDLMDRLRDELLSGQISGAEDERKRLLLRLEMERTKSARAGVAKSSGGGDSDTKNVSIEAAEAAKQLALELAASDQNSGNYKNAFRTLVDYVTVTTDAESSRQQLDQHIDSALVLLHSYLVGRSCIRNNEHKAAAQLLLRIADQHLDRFPAHRIAIVTSAVIECYRSDYRTDAVRLAQLLVRKQQSSQPHHLDPKFRSKIEAIAALSTTKADKSYRDSTSITCPFCDWQQSPTLIVCTNCNTKLPLCLLSCQFLDCSNFAYCDQCLFCFNFKALEIMVEENRKCPFCSKSLDPNQNRSLKIVQQQPKHLRTHFIRYLNSEVPADS